MNKEVQELVRAAEYLVFVTTTEGTTDEQHNLALKEVNAAIEKVKKLDE